MLGESSAVAMSPQGQHEIEGEICTLPSRLPGTIALIVIGVNEIFCVIFSAYPEMPGRR
jgi:hypothetical protein